MEEVNRPEGCRFWEAEDVVDWVKANVPDKDAPDGSEAAVLWWKACIDADSLRDLNARELAQFCLDGMSPTTIQDVTDELQAPHLDEPYWWTVEEFDNDVEDKLRDHFGLPKREGAE